MTHAVLCTKSMPSASATSLFARSQHLRFRHARGESARKLVITAGIFDGLFGGGKGAAKVRQSYAALKDKADLSCLQANDASNSVLATADLQEVQEQGRCTMPWMQGTASPYAALAMDTALSPFLNVQGTGRNKKNGNMFERWK
ncbi:hypothetical protein ABBQ32_011049 [Trebouxia sp. C0010 RCD-2024]